MNNSGNTLLFIKEIAKYFMDFLETDFHKRRNPRRSIKLHSEDNLLLGIQLAKYPEFEREVHRTFLKGFAKPVTISKKEYRAPIPDDLLNLVKLQIDSLKQEQIDQAVTEMAAEIEQHIIWSADQYDQAVLGIEESASLAIRKCLVQPLLRALDKPLQNLSLGDENTSFQLETDLTQILFKLSESKIGQLLRSGMTGQAIQAANELRELIGISQVREVLAGFFESFRAADLYSELYELSKNQKILDKQEFYLYFCDVAFDRVKYPIFYLPFELSQQEDRFEIQFDSRLYINKRALEYIAQQHNLLTGEAGSLSTISERILYLAALSDSLVYKLKGIVGELLNFFKLEGPVDLTSYLAQSARGQHARLSNRLYVALFDKSDESLVNDYEEMLALGADNPLVKAFEGLIEDFIHKDPKVINAEVDDEWDGQDVISRLVYQSPIPLNSEQLKIRAALAKSDCKYLVVEGPPGTGKSHTITAIVFDQLLNDRSTLVLSDKKEALDVVEDKISDTLNQVRLDKNFQNPILRLGKTGSTYAQILSTSSVDNINLHYRAVKHQESSLQASIAKTTEDVAAMLDEESSGAEEIRLSAVQELVILDKETAAGQALIDLTEVLSHPESAEEFTELRDSMRVLADGHFISSSPYDLCRRLKPEEVDSLQSLVTAIEALDKGVSESDLPSIMRDVEKLRRLPPQGLGSLEKSLMRFQAAWEELSSLCRSETCLSSAAEKASASVTVARGLASTVEAACQMVHQASSVFPARQTGAALFPTLTDRDAEDIERLVVSFESFRLPVIGFLFRKHKLERINLEFRKRFPYFQAEQPHKYLQQLSKLVALHKYLTELQKKAAGAVSEIDLLALLHSSGNEDSAAARLLKRCGNLKSEIESMITQLDREGIIALFEICSPSRVQTLLSSCQFLRRCVEAERLASPFQGRLINVELPQDFAVFIAKANSLPELALLLRKEMEAFKRLGTLAEELQFLSECWIRYPSSAKRLGIILNDLKTLSQNPLLELDDTIFEKLIRSLLSG